MHLFVMSFIMLSFSLVAQGDYKADFYRGSGRNHDQEGRSKGNYSVLIEMKEGGIVNYFSNSGISKLLRNNEITTFALCANSS